MQEQAVVTSVTTTTTKVTPNYIFEEEYRPWWFWVLIVFPCAMPAVWRYHIRLTENGDISVGYSCCGCFQLHVDRARIVSVEVIQEIQPIMEWGGYGVKKHLPDWETGYIAEKGAGVRMIYINEKGTETPVTFTCRDPATLCNLISSSK